jgi:hypothetical protein
MARRTSELHGPALPFFSPGHVRRVNRSDPPLSQAERPVQGRGGEGRGRLLLCLSRGCYKTSRSLRVQTVLYTILTGSWQNGVGIEFGGDDGRRREGPGARARDGDGCREEGGRER